MTPHARAELEHALRALPPAAVRTARGHVTRLQRLQQRTGQLLLLLLLLLEHERDLYDDAVDAGSAQSYLSAVEQLTRDLDATVLALSATWSRPRALLPSPVTRPGPGPPASSVALGVRQARRGVDHAPYLGRG